MSNHNTASMAFANTTALDAVVAQAATSLYRTVNALVAHITATFSDRPVDTIADLLARAEQYEATNPSYAADLRAAAGLKD